MSRESAGQAFKLLTAHYGTLLKLFTETAGATAEVYIRGLQDIEPDLLEAAVMQCITTGKYYPHPGVADIRSEAAALTKIETRTGMEAWGDVTKAMRIYTPDIPQESRQRASAGLDEYTLRIMDDLGWNYLFCSEDEMADRAHFIKAYEQLRERDKREALMLPEIRAVIEGVTKRLALKGRG